ncbi:DNA sulfur modification protein DndB [Niallia taxi]|uniref:DNA sulfur modification protein DndB n=1 Tax=Niallia taxi TaxID=2499688 RepID=UPI003173826F
MKKPRKMLENNLIQILNETDLRANDTVVEEIKMNLLRSHNIKGVRSILNNPETKIPELDLRELMLFGEQVYFRTKIDLIKPEDFFTDIEIAECRKFSGNSKKIEESIDYPILIQHADILGNSAYQVALDIKTINKLLNSNVLYYDPDVQREPSKTKRKNITIVQPTLVMKNVEEITKHLLEDTLVPTQLVFNATPGSADSGTELDFDVKTRNLEITRGTKLAIVDGFHRCTAAQAALSQNPNLSFNFSVLITNYEQNQTMQYQAQTAKATPIAAGRVEELEGKEFSDIVVSTLKIGSELKGKVSSNERPRVEHGELVSYTLMSRTIREEFKIQKRIEATKIGKYLTTFFDYLLGSYDDEFLNKAEEVNKYSLINSNPMFIGYITLAAEMYRREIDPSEVIDYIDKINFNRDNSLWKEINLVDDKGRINSRIYKNKTIKNALKNVFENLI